MRAQTGAVLGGRYELTSPVAAGGMGEVWRARDELLGRTVAVKVLRSELASDPGFLERFRTEARHSARLAHPAIATTYDYGESDGSAYLVMELVPGEPLSDVLAREGALEPRRALRLLSRAAAGLAAAHAAGLVHRDVKPGNLLVTPSGDVKITDFGIARALAEAPLTATGQVMGTAAYLSPEQATGRRDLTPAADVYALGVVAHEMLAGQRPFGGESQVAIALAQVNDAPPPLPASVPQSARALVSACLAKDPLQRPHDAGLVARVAGLVADGDDVGALTALAGAPTALLPPAAGTAPPVTATSVLPPGAAGAAGGAGGAPVPTTRRTPAGPPAGPPEGTRGGVTRGGVPGRPRRRLTVPLLGLLAVLVVVAAALALSQHRSPPAPSSPAPSTTAPVTVPSPPASTTRSTPSRTSSAPSPTSRSTSAPATPTGTTSAPTTSPTTSPSSPPPSSASSSATPTPTPTRTRTPSPSPTTPASPTTTPAAAGGSADTPSPPATAAAAHRVGADQDETEAGSA